MPNVPVPVRIAAALFAFCGFAHADKFAINRAREHEPHIVMQLSPPQIATVGRERKLILTQDQRETLARFTKKVPRVLGVESLGEPDCSCHISSALWTATNEVTIWIDRLRGDPHGSKAYYEGRRQRGYYTANANGELFAAGKPVSWPAFEAAVLRKKDNEYIQLSLPPNAPKDFIRRVHKLDAIGDFNYRL